MGSPTPCYTPAIGQAAAGVAPAARRRTRPASVTPLYPAAVLPDQPAPAVRPAGPRRLGSAAGWTLLLLPPARSARAVRTVPLRRRHALLPLTAAAVLLAAVAYGAGRLGMLRHEVLIAPEVERLSAGVVDAEARLSATRDSMGALQARVDTLNAVVEARRLAEHTTARNVARAGARSVAGLVLPLDGRITSRYAPSRLHPILRIRRPHRGIDIAAPAGTAITAPAAGRVTRVTRDLGYGLVLHVDHGGGTITRYAHLRSTLVEEGQRVAAGERIATVGSSGLATAPHLHYEVRVGGAPVDPLRVPVTAGGPRPPVTVQGP